MNDKVVDFKPNDLRFTEHSIANYVQHWKDPKDPAKELEGITLKDAEDRIAHGSMSHTDFPRIEVYAEKEFGSGIKWWSNHNSILWVFRKACLPNIKVNLLNEPFESIAKASGSDKQKWADKDYFPRERERKDDVDPNDLRFTQNTIAKRIHWGDKMISLEEAQRGIEDGSLKYTDVDLIQVCTAKKSGITWSNDNRRLWVFRKAGLTNISVDLFDEQLDEPLSRIPAEGSINRRTWAAPNYFPKVRKRVNDNISDDDSDSED